MIISEAAIDYLKRQTTPTVEGLRRYFPTGFYIEDPCTCTGTCQDDCEGGCGCAACDSLAKDEGLVTA